MTTAQVYWLTRLDGIHDFLTFACIIALCVVPIASLVAYMKVDLDMDDDEAGKKSAIGKWAKPGVLITLCLGLLSCFVPTTKELIAIYGISYLTQNKDAREIPAEALKVLNQKLKDLETDKE